MVRLGDDTACHSVMWSLRRTICTALGILVALLVFTQQGAAEPRRKQEVESHYNQGMKQYTLGHFPEAIEEFEKAYDLKPEPIFLYNIAQSHRQNKNPERAAFFYRRYLEAEPRAKNRAEVEKRINDMEKLVAQEKERAAAPALQPPPPTAPPPPPPPPPRLVVTPAPAPAPPPRPVAPKRREDSGSPGHGLRIAGVVVGSVGLAGVGAGIAFGVYQAKLHNQANQGIYNPAKENSSDNFRTLELVSLGVGGAALATGIVLYIVGAASNGPDQTVSFVPLLAPGMRGIALSGRL